MEIKDTKPDLFQRSNGNIWTDPHIQQQMLREHLNPDSDGASRNRHSILKIVDFIESQIKPGIRMLDLGCGPGLYAEHFRNLGHAVTGIDFNKASIDHARGRRQDIRYIQGDYIRQYPQDTYDVVTMIYCDMGTHSDDERTVLLESIFHSLAKGGRLIFDVFSEKLVKDKKEDRHWDYAPSGGFWSKDEYLLLSQTFHYPESRCFACQYNLLTKNGSQHFIIWDKYYDKEEIMKILKVIGFKRVSVYKDILGLNNFTSDSEMFVVAEK